MDSLRITLLIIGAIFIALVYGWERIKRRKSDDRYARWGVSDEAEAHIVGRNSGDPETDSRLVSTAYESELNDSSHNDTRGDIPYVTEEIHTEHDPEPDQQDSSSLSIDEADEKNWQKHSPANIHNEYEEEIEPDLDSDPELNVTDSSIEDITSELEALEEMISHEPEQDEMELGDLNVPVEPPPAQPDRVIIVHVLAKEGEMFAGPDIVDKLTQLGMQFDDMNVFQCFGTNRKSIFSIVNAVEPGIFDLSEIETMKTPALLLMMTLPNQLPALEAFDGMLGVARSLANSLNGRLCDETRSVLTRQAIDELRAELVNL